MKLKTINLQEDTYKKLLQIKQENECFDNLIQRLIHKYQDLTPYFGMFSEKDGDLLENAIEEVRKSNDKADLNRRDGN